VHVLAVDLVDLDLAADVGFPRVGRRRSFALGGREQQDVAVEPLRSEIAGEPTVVFEDLDDRSDLMLPEGREEVALTALLLGNSREP